MPFLYCLLLVLYDLITVVQDFFGQLRASGSGVFGKYSMEGLSTGLKESSVALQVLQLFNLSVSLRVWRILILANSRSRSRCVLQMLCTCCWGSHRPIRAQKCCVCLKCGEIGSCPSVRPSMKRSCTWRRMCGNPAGLVSRPHDLFRFLTR